MLIEALLALTTVLPRIDAGIESVRAHATARTAAIAWPAQPVQAGPSSLAYFSSTARAVSNWRNEAGAALMPASLALVAKYAVGEPTFVARCVKLNNYWCIKQAGWSGELGGDAEGHTGFATASEGADAAASLLRRYYQDYNRRSALAIVRRWAPAECGIAGAARGPVAGARVGTKISADLAPRGIGGTLRARFLASHARSGAPLRASKRVADGGALRVQPWSARARLAGHPRMATASRIAPRTLPAPKPVADIATGILPTRSDSAAEARSPAKPSRVDDAPKRAARSVPLVPAVLRPSRPPPVAGAVNPAALLASDRLVAEAAALPSIVTGLPGGSLLDLRVPPPLCSNDETRIRNYAARIAQSVGLKPDDDLVLFEADGRPTERLAPVMLAMSSVELGSLRATPALIATAIARLTVRRTAATSETDTARR